MTLKSLDEFNSERRRAYAAMAPKGNGIACPKCGSELHDQVGGVQLASMPPQMVVECPHCDYRGTRVA